MTLKEHAKTGETIQREIDSCFDRHCSSGYNMKKEEVTEYEAELLKLKTQEWVPLAVAEAEIQRQEIILTATIKMKNTEIQKLTEEKDEYKRVVAKLILDVAEARKILDSLWEDKIATTLIRADLERLRFTLSGQSTPKKEATK